MKQYKNSDRCPCCGQLLTGKSPWWLREFSRIVDMLRLPPWEANSLSESGVSAR